MTIGPLFSDKNVKEPDTPSLNTQHAQIEFIKTVKERFADDLNSYLEFHIIFRCYDEDRLTWNEVVRDIQKLFRNHPDLLAGFSVFSEI